MKSLERSQHALAKGLAFPWEQYNRHYGGLDLDVLPEAEGTRPVSGIALLQPSQLPITSPEQQNVVMGLQGGHFPVTGAQLISSTGSHQASAHQLVRLPDGRMAVMLLQNLGGPVSARGSMDGAAHSQHPQHLQHQLQQQQEQLTGKISSRGSMDGSFQQQQQHLQQQPGPPIQILHHAAVQNQQAGLPLGYLGQNHHHHQQQQQLVRLPDGRVAVMLQQFNQHPQQPIGGDQILASAAPQVVTLPDGRTAMVRMVGSGVSQAAFGGSGTNNSSPNPAVAAPHRLQGDPTDGHGVLQLGPQAPSYFPTQPGQQSLLSGIPQNPLHPGGGRGAGVSDLTPSPLVRLLPDGRFAKLQPGVLVLGGSQPRTSGDMHVAPSQQQRGSRGRDGNRLSSMAAPPPPPQEVIDLASESDDERNGGSEAGAPSHLQPEILKVCASRLQQIIASRSELLQVVAIFYMLHHDHKSCS